MSRWYRAYEGTVTDAKLGEVALVAECSRSVAIAAWHCILESCAAANDGGNFDATLRRVAVILCEPVSAIEKVFAEFENLGLIQGNRVPSWSKRQYESDNSTARSRKHRENKRAENSNDNATLQGRCATPPETETETETETERNSGGGLLTRATAAAAAEPEIERIGQGELVRRLEQATGWKCETRNIGQIEKLIASGVDLEGRIIPIARTVAAELARQGKPPPDTWAYLAKPIADPARIATPASREIDLVWIRPDTPEWQSMLAAGKKESFLRGQLRKSPDGLEAMPIARASLPQQGAA